VYVNVYVVSFRRKDPIGTKVDAEVMDIDGTNTFHNKSAAGLPHGNAPSLPDIDAVLLVKAGKVEKFML
jgi:hypothetical protein